MNTSKYFSISIRDGVATLVATESTSLTFIGASCSCSALPGEQELTTFSLCPETGKDAVFAIRLHYTPSGAHNPNETHGLLLALTWDNDRLVCCTDKPFVPAAPALAHVGARWSALCLTYPEAGGIGVLRFSAPSKNYESEVRKEGWRIADGNLLCRFLAGNAQYDDLLKEAEESDLQKLQREYDKLSAREQGLSKDFAARTKELTASEVKLAAAVQRLLEIEAENEGRKRTLGFISRHTGSINHLLAMRWNLFSRRTWFGNRIPKIAYWMSQIETHNPSAARAPDKA